MSEAAGDGAPALPAETVKQCCATFYGSDAARFLLGDSFHPGGTALTHELGTRLALGPQSRVLDVASGRGTSALYLAEQFGCEVIGVDLSEENIRLARAAAVERGLHHRVRFALGDAEQLPFANAHFAALICECAFCTFPDKATAAKEFCRVLSPGARLGFTDLTKAGGTPAALEGLLAWIACIGDAQPAASYQEWLRGAGFTMDEQHDRSDCLGALVKQVRGRVLLAEVMTGLHKLNIPDMDLSQVKKFLEAATLAIARRELGYTLLLATSPRL